MITFLISGDFILNAKYLSDQHLGKQRVEAIQILTALQTNKGWINHPMTRAWKNFELALKYYINCVITEWINRGHNNNLELYDIPDEVDLPWWTQWDRLHYSHQAMLNRKNPFNYNFDVPSEYLDYGYIWPTDDIDQDAELSLIAADIPEFLLEPDFCQAELKKGGICNILIKDGYPFCGKHQKREVILCPALLKSGTRKGQVCNSRVRFYSQEFCKKHL